jgi:hypothetical protein
MSIIRSNIARQLLAEGGAPRKGFARGSTGFEGSPEMGGSRSDSPSRDDGFGGGDDVQRDTYAQQLENIQRLEGSETGDTFPNIDKVTARDLFKASATNPLLYRSPGERAALASFPLVGPLITAGEQFAYDLPMFQYSMTGGNKNRFNEDDDDSDPIILPKLRAPIEEKEPELTDFQQLLARAGARFEDGGDVRQEYGLGSIVKKIGRTVKKVAKSPVGKAALLAAPFAFPAVRAGGANFLAGLTKDKLMLRNFIDATTGAYKAGSFLSNPFVGIPTVAALSGLLTKQEEDEDETLPAAVRSDPEIRKALEYRGLAFAQGGEVEDEMLDLGGNEMDLRGGGFVPLGEYEKKDDVPARLSKNEFVFTADAVRAAGGGSVDKGADVMYKTMKTLENKVA